MSAARSKGAKSPFSRATGAATASCPANSTSAPIFTASSSSASSASFPISAVGSLKEEHKPLEFVIPDQFFDRTRHRVDTFFGGGIVAHIAFADPVCGELARVVESACKKAGVVGKHGGTYLCMEGPQFSTKAESNVYRGLGMDVIGMTNLQEAKLAREAEICYVTVAMVTDYDCWHPHHDSVTVDQIVAVLIKNAENAAKVVRQTVAAMPQQRSCKCGSALAHAILTDRKKIPAATRKKLSLILGKYLKNRRHESHAAGRSSESRAVRASRELARGTQTGHA